MLDFDLIRERADNFIDAVTEFLVNVSEDVISYAEAVYEALDTED